MAQQHGLGRGLSSLIPPKKSGMDSPFKDMVLKTMAAQGISIDGEDKNPIKTMPEQLSMSSKGSISEISVSAIVPNPHQPRLRFDEMKLTELANSIREHGILQPLVVTSLGGGEYELIAGERRLQAAKQVGLSTVPVIVRDAKSQEKLELAIIENIQRHDLNPIEEARAYEQLIEEFGLKQEEVAVKMGKSRSSVANSLRLLSLPVEMQRALGEEKISEGHAKALLAIENPEKQRALFELIMKTGMTVREAEGKAREVSVRPHTRRVASLPPEIAEKAERLSTALGTKVAVKPSGKGGRIIVEYYSNEDLDSILARVAQD